MVLPAPVWPTMATVWPGSTVKETSFRIHSMSVNAASSVRAFGRFGAAVHELSLFGRQLLIGEPDMAELDAVRSVARCVDCAGLTISGCGIEQLEDALAGGHGGLQDVVLVAQVLNGPPEALRVLLNMASTPMVTVPGEHAEAAAPDHERDGDRRQEFDRGVVERVGKDRVFERDHVQAVDCFKVLVGALFAIEELHHAPCRRCVPA